MTDRATLQKLIAELKSIRSPVERMRLLARAWSTVRELSPEERREIATRVGMKEVSAFMERLGLKQDFVSDAVIEDVVGIIHPPEGDGGSTEETVPVSEAEVAPAVEEREPVVEEVEPPSVEEDLASPAIVTPPEPEPIEASVIATVEPEPDDEDEREVEPSAEIAPPEAVDALAVEAPDPLPRELLDTASLSRRFRLLKDRLRDPATAGKLPVDAVVECFPDGWARRRALSLLFRAGLPDSTPEAIALIAALASKTDRRWCAAALAECRRLTGDEAADLLEQVPSPLFRRRVQTQIDLMS
ncbi:MAG: hypothetical protein R3344_01220 [Acidobacteriota bacterium]|nr:hypothetical protein [Acidobacteriota bacterium]